MILAVMNFCIYSIILVSRSLLLICLMQVGNVYAQFREEEQAAAALQGMTGRFYAGMLSVFKFSCF